MTALQLDEVNRAEVEHWKRLYLESEANRAALEEALAETLQRVEAAELRVAAVYRELAKLSQ